MVQLDDVPKIVAQTALEWATNMTEEEIKKKVLLMLEKRHENIVCQLIGFTDKWGKWELDTKNGWFIDSFMKAHEDTIKNYVKEFKPPTLNARHKQQINKDIQEEFAYRVRKTVDQQLETKAQDAIDTLIKELIPEDYVANHIAALKLLINNRK